jgi:hypothetical protein
MARFGRRKNQASSKSLGARFKQFLTLFLSACFDALVNDDSPDAR